MVSRKKIHKNIVVSVFGFPNIYSSCEICIDIFENLPDNIYEFQRNHFTYSEKLTNTAPNSDNMHMYSDEKILKQKINFI